MSTVLIAFIRFVSAFSWKTLYRLSDLASFLLFRVAGYRKEIITENIARSFPDKGEGAQRSIANRFHVHFTDLIVETLKLTQAVPDEIRERMRLSERDLETLNSVQRGAVVVLGHRGNWEMANLYASSSLKPEIIVVYRPLTSAAFEKWFRQLRTRFGSTLVPMRNIYAELEKPRTRPYLVFLVNDQSPNPATAYWTRFLNQDTGVFRGAEHIARQYDLPVFFADIRKSDSKRGFYHLEIHTLTDQPHTEAKNHILEKQISELEKRIRMQPENWLWSHKRWKHKKPVHLHAEQLPDG